MNIHPKKSQLVLLPFVMAAVLMVIACGKAAYDKLSDEDLTWMIYSKGQQLKFKNGAGDVLTFEVYDVRRGYKKDGDNYKEATQAMFVMTGDTTQSSGQIDISRASGNGTTITFTWPHFNNTVDLRAAAVVTDTAGGTVYTDVAVANASSVSAINFIKTVYYSKSAGVIRMTDAGSIAWSRFY